ncbi:MAG: LysR family transcriptional regulator [Myxococcota bacterium]
MTLKSWDDLRFVLSIAREGTLTRAARALGVDQTTVTRRLRALEEKLAIRLFDVLRGGVRLTAAGEAVVEAAVAVEDQLLSLGRRLDGVDEEPTGLLRLTLPELLATLWIDELRNFTDRYPQLDLELVVDDDFRSLTRREADVALRRVADPPEHLVGRRLAPMAEAMYGAPSLLNRPRETWPWFGWSSSTTGTLEAARAATSPDQPVVMYANSVPVLLEAARRGHTVLSLACVFGDADPGLVRLTEPRLGDSSLWILTHSDLRHSPRIRVIIDHFARFARTQAPKLLGGLTKEGV